MFTMNGDADFACDANTNTSLSCSDMPMKKVRSVDFSRMTFRATKSKPTAAAASMFSQRAARGSFKE
jgi:ribosomal protein S11